MMVCACHPSYSGKHKIRRLQSGRPGKKLSVPLKEERERKEQKGKVREWRREEHKHEPI
jgi:hypothetical protein